MYVSEVLYIFKKAYKTRQTSAVQGLTGCLLFCTKKLSYTTNNIKKGRLNTKDTKTFAKPVKNAGELKNPQKVHRAFSLVELVIAILIIAVLVAAVFAGGSIIIKYAQISRTTSDLHNFSIAVESWMNQNPTIANVLNNESYKKDTALYNSFNALLAEDYKLEDVANTSNITAVQAADEGDYYIYRSKKTDAWGNAYYVVFTDQERSDLEGTKHSEFFVEVISAGPNAKAKIGGTEGKIDVDDIFLVGQYTDGNVISKIFNYDNDQPADNSGVVATSYIANVKAPIITKKLITPSPTMLMYDGTDLAGTTWKFNSQISEYPFGTLNISGKVWNNEYTYYSFKYFDAEPVYDYRIFSFYYPSIETPYNIGDGFVYIPENELGFQKGWNFGNTQDYSTYHLTSTPTVFFLGGSDSTNTELIAWLETNATRITASHTYG